MSDASFPNPSSLDTDADLIADDAPPPSYDFVVAATSRSPSSNIVRRSIPPSNAPSAAQYSRISRREQLRRERELDYSNDLGQRNNFSAGCHLASGSAPLFKDDSASSSVPSSSSSPGGLSIISSGITALIQEFSQAALTSYKESSMYKQAYSNKPGCCGRLCSTFARGIEDHLAAGASASTSTALPKYCYGQKSCCSTPTQMVRHNMQLNQQWSGELKYAKRTARIERKIERNDRKLERKTIKYTPNQQSSKESASCQPTPTAKQLRKQNKAERKHAEKMEKIESKIERNQRKFERDQRKHPGLV